jgi:predicted RNA-binding Zn-ribbon protein involved in translation (DUF1610 family)
MTRYIDADELELEYYGLSIHGTMAVKSVLPVFTELLKKQPTADVVEVKHGHWEEERWCDNFQHICSLCHSTVRVHPQSVAYKYCPYCGANMDERSNTDDR